MREIYPDRREWAFRMYRPRCGMTADQFALATGLTIDRARYWLPMFEAACERFDIAGSIRQAAFIAQCGHESQGFTRLSENLNYSADGLLATFPKYFDEESALEYQRQPVRIANRVYANRNGNGDEDSGDGWNYRGSGWIQITGKRNFLLCGIALDLDLIGNPDLLRTPANAALGAGWYWWNNDLNSFADVEDQVALCRAINGGNNGLDDRRERYATARAALLGR